MQIRLNQEKLRHQIQQSRLFFRPRILESTQKVKETSKYLRFHNAFGSASHDATTKNNTKDVNHEPNGPCMAADMIFKADSLLHQRQSYNYPVPFSKCSITPPRAPTPSAALRPIPPCHFSHPRSYITPILQYAIPRHYTLYKNRLLIMTLNNSAFVHQ